MTLALLQLTIVLIQAIRLKMPTDVGETMRFTGCRPLTLCSLATEELNAGLRGRHYSSGRSSGFNGLSGVQIACCIIDTARTTPRLGCSEGGKR